MKKIVFFDGDGTLWYPKSTKRTVKPHWIYYDEEAKKDYKPHLILTLGVVSTLGKLRKLGILTVVVSTNPHTAKEADALLKEKVRHLGLESLFDEVHAARNVPTGKGAVMARVLKRLKLSKSSALMVGDSYIWDYRAAQSVGVEGLLIDTDYLTSYAGAERIKRVIKNLDEVLGYATLK